MSSGPPNKVVAVGSLATYVTPTDIATAISAFEQAFFVNYGVYPNQVLIYKDELYLGAY
jgi:hypothetical protein